MRAFALFSVVFMANQLICFNFSVVESNSTIALAAGLGGALFVVIVIAMVLILRERRRRKRAFNAQGSTLRGNDIRYCMGVPEKSPPIWLALELLSYLSSLYFSLPCFIVFPFKILYCTNNTHWL